MTCTECAKAYANPSEEAFASGCEECACRMMAAGIDAATSKHYQAALDKVFGDKAQDAFKRIKVWAERIKGVAP